MPVRHATDVGRERDRSVRSDSLGADPLHAGGLRDPLTVQARGALRGDVSAAAARGVAGGETTFPHFGRIQAAFGDHDLSGARAHAGEEARDACGSLGAEAFTTGSDVAFAGAPSLHTAAHEAAHYVQQQGGVSLKGGVGEAGDPYEAHADRVADLVVAGKSAATALDAAPVGGGGGAVQLKPAMGIDGHSVLHTFDDKSGKSIQKHAIGFGGLSNDCGTSMDGWLYPTDNIVYGGSPSVEPSWWGNLHIDAENANKGASSWISNYVVQGHLLNDNLGGPGNDMRNLTPIAKGCNSHHSAKVESDVKTWVWGNNNIAHYQVTPIYTSSGPDSDWFNHWIPAKYLKKFPRKLKIVHEEYDGTTRKFIQGYNSEITNAVSGKG